MFWRKLQDILTSPHTLFETVENESFLDTTKYVFFLFFIGFIIDLPSSFQNIQAGYDIVLSLLIYGLTLLVSFILFYLLVLSNTSTHYILLYLFEDEADFKTCYRISSYAATPLLILFFIQGLVYLGSFLVTGQPVVVESGTNTSLLTVFGTLFGFALGYTFYLQVTGLRNSVSEAWKKWSIPIAGFFVTFLAFILIVIFLSYVQYILTV